jgi:hypothetical protein
MFRRTTLVILITVAIAGSVLFQIKYSVIDFEQRNNHAKRSIQETQESLHILKAEWAHLNDPNRLKLLAEKYLPHLKPIRGSQIIHINHVEMTSKNKTPESQNYDKKQLDSFLSKELEEDEGAKNSIKEEVAP